VIDAVRCTIEGQNGLVDRSVFAPYVQKKAS
jgi:hypothetical protein